MWLSHSLANTIISKEISICQLNILKSTSLYQILYLSNKSLHSSFIVPEWVGIHPETTNLHILFFWTPLVLPKLDYSYKLQNIPTLLNLNTCCCTQENSKLSPKNKNYKFHPWKHHIYCLTILGEANTPGCGSICVLT